ncbi:MAG: hypothetical protein COB83_09005 [Gammaproteobacteria bacterium]|nr:MAG: hypothetical protein COB83_09005 [Gammaproteobacteria bacterium]
MFIQVLRWIFSIVTIIFSIAISIKGFSNGQWIIGLLSLLPLTICIPSVLDKLNNNSKKQADENGKEHKELSMKGAITMSWVCLLLLAGAIDTPENKNKTNEQSSQETPISQNTETQDPLRNIQPKPYEVVKINDISFAGRKRMEWIIVAPTAKTKLSRAATAKAAARELQRTQRANVAYIMLEQSKTTYGQGNAYAIVNYYPDACGNSGEDCNGVKWEIEASDYVPTEIEINTLELWTASRDNFSGDDGVLDLEEEKLLVAAIAERLKIDVPQVKLPYIKREKI